jgi:sRNA-binding regulator protein Hfq
MIRHLQIIYVKNGIRLPEVLAQYDKGNYTCIVRSKQTEMVRTFMIDISSKFFSLVHVVTI